MEGQRERERERTMANDDSTDRISVISGMIIRRIERST
jgi:hypothetical protein